MVTRDRKMASFSTKNSDFPHSQYIEGTWQDFRDDVAKVDPEFCQIIDNIQPSKKLKLYKGIYQYGEYITDLGTICVPNDQGKTQRIDSPNVPSSLKEKLQYCPTPLILQLKRSSEVFIETADRIIPLNVFLPGDMYGLFETLVPYTKCPIVPCWSVTSGVRSAFMAAKVSDAIGNKNLAKEFHIDPADADNLANQWYIFKNIANQALETEPWTSEVLIFTGEWFNNNPDNLPWLKFQNYLLKRAWLKYRNTIIKSEFSILWETFANKVSYRNYKPDAYIINSIIHMLFMSNGTCPGFRPITDCEDILLPASIIEKTYHDVYGMLRDYAPVMLAPAVFSAHNDFNPVYYSFYYPTLLEGAFFKADATPATMQVIRRIMPFMELLIDILKKQRSELFNLLQKAKFTYYHPKVDRYGEVQACEEILNVDKNFSICLEKFSGKKLAVHGPFFRGCVQITNFTE